MIRLLIFLSIIITIYANSIVKDIIQQDCGPNWFNKTENYCDAITKENAAKIIGILCLQK
jgi:hypothetical protein